MQKAVRISSQGRKTVYKSRIDKVLRVVRWTQRFMGDFKEKKDEVFSAYFMLSVVLISITLLAGSASATLIDVIDNGDTMGYSETGDIGWSYSVKMSPTYDGNVSYTSKSGNAATWSFGGLDNGVYKVYAIWVNHSLATTFANYTISDSSDNLLVKKVNQQNAVAHDFLINVLHTDFVDSTSMRSHKIQIPIKLNYG